MQQLLLLLQFLKGAHNPGSGFPKRYVQQLNDLQTQVINSNVIKLLFKFSIQPEGISVEARELLLNRATEGTINFIMNK